MESKRVRVWDTFWGRRIRRARRRGFFTFREQNEAAQWTTCACGKQDPRIPRCAAGRPIDSALENLGQRFYVCVEASNFHGAFETLKKIEIRAAQVLAGLPS